MTESELLTLYLEYNYPTISEQSITEPARAVWIAQAREWYKDQTSTGFRRALVEFRKLQGCRHWSRERTLKQAREAFRRAGLMS